MKNKTILWVKLILLVVIFLTVIGFFLESMFGSNTFFSFTGWNGGIFNNGLNGYEDHKVIDSSKSAGIDIDFIEDIEVDFVSGDLEIIPFDGEEIIIEYKKPANGKNLLYVVDGDTLKIQIEKMNNWFNFGSNRNGDILLKIPENLMLDYHLDGVSGDTDVSVSGKDMAVDTVSGDVTVEGNAKELEVDFVSGNVSITGIFEELDADGVSGNVSFLLDKETRNVNIDSVSGDTTMEDDSDGFTIEFDSVSGKIEDENNDRSFESEYYDVGDGKIEIDVDTVSGSFIIED